MYTSKCSDAMPAPLQLSCFCRSCIGVQLLQQQQSLNSDSCNSSSHLRGGRGGLHNTRNTSAGSGTRLHNGDASCTVDSSSTAATAATHLPYHLSAMVCHLGASLSSGEYGHMETHLLQQLPRMVIAANLSDVWLFRWHSFAPYLTQDYYIIFIIIILIFIISKMSNASSSRKN